MSFARRIASSSPVNGMTQATGPKISSRAARSVVATGCSTVGANQKPGLFGVLPWIAIGVYLAGMALVVAYLAHAYWIWRGKVQRVYH